MIKYKLGKLVPIIIVSLVLLLALAVPAQANGAAVAIPDATVDSGDVVVLPINISGVTNLGSATIWLSYDNSVVTVDNVADGDMGTVTAAIFNGDGVTKMTWYDAYGKSGTLVYAQVTLHAATTSVSLSSVLDLDVKEFIDTSFNPIVPTVTDGTFDIVVTPGVPTIGRSPASLSFSATEGGSNPAAKTFEVWNSGTGTLNWAVSDNAAWLTLAPPSGSSTGEHDVVTASVNIGSMTDGDYSGTITIAATGATNTPQTVSVSLHISPAGAVGGTAYPPNKLLMVVPWIVLGGAIIAGTTLLVRRRRSAVR